MNVISHLIGQYLYSSLRLDKPVSQLVGLLIITKNLTIKIIYNAKVGGFAIPANLELIKN